jgi:Domain of unknown function (DUF4291)
MQEHASPPVPYRQIRALYTGHTLTVYQAYSPAIAEAALAAGTFVPPFRPACTSRARSRAGSGNQ